LGGAKRGTPQREGFKPARGGGKPPSQKKGPFGGIFPGQKGGAPYGENPPIIGGKIFLQKTSFWRKKALNLCGPPKG